MAQNKRDIADILHDYISDASERIEESLEISKFIFLITRLSRHISLFNNSYIFSAEPHPITMPIQENVTICAVFHTFRRIEQDALYTTYAYYLLV